MIKFKFLPRDKISQLPKTSGVYVFKKNREFLYIGKAANVKERVKNHFLQPTYRDNLFINQVSKIGYLKTDSEIEALILEANLIKKYDPKYNVVLRDDKNYFFVAVTKEDFPRVFITHQPKAVSDSLYPVSSIPNKKIRDTKYKIQNTRFVGPFVDGKALKQALKVLRKVFPYRSCNNLPRHPCLWYQLSRCPAPCLTITKNQNYGSRTSIILKDRMKSECQRNVKNLLRFLSRGRTDALKDLKKVMKKVSLSQDFEKAAKIRDQIAALEKVLAHAKIFEPQIENEGWKKIEKELKKLLRIKGKVSRIEAYDVSNIQGELAAGSMVTFISGQPDKNFYRKFKIKISGKPNDIAMIKECLTRRFKHPEWGWPDLILIDGGKAQLNAALQCLKWEIKQGKRVKAAALAKKKNELFIEGREKPILLKNLPREVFNLILQLRDEAHRFAISYHKRLREKVLLES